MREIFSPHTVALIHVAAVLLNGTVFNLLLFLAGLHYGNRYAVILALASTGLAYMSAQFALIEAHPAYALSFVGMAIACAVLGGLLLILA